MARTVSVGTIEALLRLKDTNYTSGLRNAGRATSSFQQQAGRAAQTVTRLFAAGAAATVAWSAASIKLATDLNRSMANVATLIPGSTQRVVELRQEVQKLAIAHGKDTQDLAAGLYQTISAFGDQAADTVEILRINSEAAAAGIASTEDSINLTAAVTKAWGDTSAGAVQHAADLALMTVRLGQTDFPQLAGAMGKVVPLAQAVGQTQEEMFAVFATGTGVTGTAAEVTTQYRGILQAMMNPTKEMTELIKAQGFTSGEALISQRGMSETMQLITEAADKSGKPLQAYISSIEAVPLALALAGPQAETFNEKLAQMRDAAGTAAEAFNEQTQGINKAGFMYNQLKQQVVVLAQNMGEVLMPVVIHVMGAIQRMITDRGGIPGLITAFQQWLPKAIGKSLDAFVLLTRGLRLLQQAWAHAVGGMAHLWDLLVAGVNKGAALMVRAYNMTISAMRMMDEETEVQALAWNMAQGQIERYAESLDDASSGAMQRIRVRARELKDGWEETWEAQTVLEDGVESFKNTITDTIAKVVTLGTKTSDYTVKAVEAKEATEETGEALSQTATDAVEAGKALSSVIDSFFGSIDTGNNLLNTFIGTIGKLFSKMVGEDGLVGAFTKVKDTIAGLFSNKDGGINIGEALRGMFSSGGSGEKAAEAAGSGFTTALINGMSVTIPSGTAEVASKGAAGLLGKFQEILGSAASFMPIIGPMIAAFAPLLIKGIGKLGSLIKSAFGRIFKSTEDFRSERAGSIFGVFEVPQSVLDSLGQMSAQFSKAKRELPDTIASLVGFDTVIKSVGINSMPQFMLAMNKGDEAVLRLKQGIITTGEAADFFGTESLRIMQAAAVELGGTAVAEFDHMISKAVEAGITIPAEFIKATDAVTATAVAAAGAITSTAEVAVDVAAAAAVATTRVSSDAITDTTDTAMRNVGDMVDTIGKQIDNLDFEIPIDILLKDKGEGGGGSRGDFTREGFAGGTRGFRDFGMGTDVRLHGIERVQTVEQAREEASGGSGGAEEMLSLLHSLPDMIANAIRHDTRTKRRI